MQGKLKTRRSLSRQRKNSNLRGERNIWRSKVNWRLLRWVNPFDMLFGDSLNSAITIGYSEQAEIRNCGYEGFTESQEC